MRLEWIVLAVLLQALTVVVWALLRHVFTPRDPHVAFRRTLQATALSSAAYSLTPAVAAQASAIAFIMQRCRLRLPDAMSIFAGEQVSEAIAKVALLIAALGFAPFSEQARHAARIGILLCAAAAVVAVLVGQLWRRAPASFQDPRRIVRGAAVACFIKIVEGCALFAVAQSLNVHLAPAAIVFVLAVTAVGILATAVVPIPGPVGVGEAMAVAAYVQLNISLQTGIAIVAAQTAALLVARLTMAAVVMMLPSDDAVSHAGPAGTRSSKLVAAVRSVLVAPQR